MKTQSRNAVGKDCLQQLTILLFVVMAALTAPAQTIRLVSAPGNFFGDDKNGAGLVNNYAFYSISNNTGVQLPSVYVAITNIVATNRILLSSNDPGVCNLGALAPGGVKLAGFYLKGPSLTGGGDSLTGLTNEVHTIRVLDGPPGIGSILASMDFSFTNITYVAEANPNKVISITNLNPNATLGSIVPLVVVGHTGVVGSPPEMFFSPAVFDSWRPDAYQLQSSFIQFDQNPSYSNFLYFDGSTPGITNLADNNYTNTFYFRATKVTGTNVPISPFGFISSGGLIKHTTLTSVIGLTNNVIVSVTNAVTINHTVSPTNLLAAYGAVVTYTIVISNSAAVSLTLNQIVDTLPSVPDNASYVPNSATFKSLAWTNPAVNGQMLTWSRPMDLAPNSSSIFTFQAYAPYPGGQYTNTVVGIIGNETIGTTLDTDTNNASLSVFTVVPVVDVAVGKTGPANVYAASNFDYTITVTNIGPSSTTGLSITDAIPAGLSYVSSVPPATVNGNVLVWTNLDSLSGGTSTNLLVTVQSGAVGATYINVASGGNTTLDLNSTNNTSDPVFTTNITVADLAIFKTGSATGVSPFGNFNYSIFVTNYGPSTAAGVTVTDALPANVTFVSASSGGTLGAGLVTWNLGSLPAGSGTNLTLTVNSPAHGTVTNTATTASSTVDLNGTNNSSSAVVTTVTNVPPVAVDDFAVTLPNTPVTIPVLANDSDANGDPLTIVAVTQTNGTAVISGTNVVFTPDTNFTGNVVLTYTISDGFGGTNSAQIFITVSTLVDLAIGKSAPTNVYSGSPLTYTISVTNFGPTTASSVTVTDALPAGVTFVAASGSGINNSGVVTWAVGDLVNGQVTNLTLDVTAPASGVITNVATVGSATSELDYTNNTSPPVTTSVTPSADVGLGKSAAATVLAGANLTYIIDVTNFGPNIASSVVVTDALPTGVVFVSTTGGGVNNSGIVTWNLGDLANSAITNLSVTVSVLDGGSLTNTASVASPTSDPDSTNNVTPPVITSITPAADLGIVKTGPASVVYGNNFDYTISVTNFGPSTATGIIVTDSLPVNLVFVSAVPAALTNAGNQVVWTNLGSLALGEATNLTLTVSPVSSGVVSNTANVSSPVLDPNDTNNTTPPVVTTVEQAVPVVTWPVPADIVYGTPLSSLQNNATSSVPGTFDYNPTNGTVLPVGTNTLTVLFSPTDTNYATTNLSVPLVVTPAPLSVTASNASRFYGQPNPALGGSISGIQNGDNITATYATSATTNSPVGNYPIVPTFVDPNGRLVNYVVTTNNGTLTVSKAVLVVTANNTNRLYNTANPAFTYTATGFVNGEDASVLSGSPSLTTTATLGSPVGTYPIVAAADTLSATNYSFSFTDGTLTVTLGAPMVSWPTPTNIVYGTALGTNENSATATAPGTFDYNPTNGTVLPVGTNLLSVVFTPTDTNYASTNLSVDLVVLSAPLTITGDSTNKMYGQTITFAGTEFTVFGLTNGDTVTSVTLNSVGATSTANVGSYPIVPSAAVGSGLTNYFITYATNGVIVVSPATLGITANDTNKAYGQVITFAGTEFTAFGLQNGETVGSVTLTSAGAAAGAAPGPYAILASNVTGGTFNPANYNIGYTNGVLTVGAATYTAGWPTPADIIYGTPLSSLQNNATSSVVGTFDYNPPNGTVLGVGTNKLSVVFTPTDTNYASTNLSVDLVVLSAPLTITGDSTNKVYGQTITFAGTEFTVVGLTNGDTVTSVTLNSVGATGTANVGSYPIVPSAAVGSGLTNYFITYATNGVIVVSPATLGITANDTNRPYGAANPTFTYKVSGFVNGDPSSVLSGAPSLTTTATTNSLAGTYPIAVAAGTLSATNYVFSLTNGTLTVDYTGPSADVIVLLSGPATSIQGSNFVYQLVITNAGPNTSSNVIVSDSLPTNLLFIAASGNGKVTNSLVTWPTVSVLPAGGSTNYTLTVNAPNAGTFTNIASSLSVTYDPNPTNNNGMSLVSQVQTVVAPAELSAIGGTPVLNPQTGLFEETVTVTNNGVVTVLGFRVHAGGLSNGITLYNATGTNNGVPYVDYLFPLDPSNSVSLVLEFYNPLRRPFTNSLSVEPILPGNIGTVSTSGSAEVTGVFADTRIPGDTRFVMEFASVPGKTYAIIYSGDMITWMVATPSITANATVTQWYDDGPPKTISKPSSVTARFYRVIQY